MAFEMRGKVTVLPEKYSEKNLVSSVIGVINDYIPLSNTRTIGADEQVFWMRFETFEIGGSQADTLHTAPLLLSIGTCKSFYFWVLSANGVANLLFSEVNSFTISSKILPNPEVADTFAVKRPILALCDSVSRSCFPWQVRLISLLDYKPVRVLHFESRVVNIDANIRFVVIGRVDCISVLSAENFSECFTVASVKPTMWHNNVPKNIPLALGSRWMAFADLKPIYQQLSRCGDGSMDECQPLTSAVMKMNKRIWSGISAFAGTVVSGTSGAAPAGGSSPSSRPDIRLVSSRPSGPVTTDTSFVTGENADSGSIDSSPGYVTVIDLVTLHKQYLKWKKMEAAVAQVTLSKTSTVEESTFDFPHSSSSIDLDGSEHLSGTSYINVHDHCELGSLVAHFMAHRWAGVALLKFDPTGMLLFTACTRGHTFNVFRISNHPCDQRQTALHHLYILERGNIPCEVVDATFSHDSRWIAVSSNHGTTHVFPITAYGGEITVRTHTRPYVVNRTSRYHRSSGIEEHQLTRPQRNRGSINKTASLTNLSGMDSGGSCFSPLNSCRPVPMAGLDPQCPHLTVLNPNPSGPCSGGSRTGSLVRLGSSTALAPVDIPPSSTIGSDLACACPPNALYNTTNSRLPPYPEPCQIKPQARLRPHNPVNVTAGAAATALGAASGALEAVTTGSAMALSSQTTETINLGYGSVPPHSGPCAHCPALRTGTGMPVIGQTGGGRTYCQPLPIVDPIGTIHPFPCPNVSGTLMAACFSSPVCFLPQRPHQSNPGSDYSRDPYGNQSRSMDALFILTNDLYLVEYDMCVGPAESVGYGEKFYQDGSIRLDCNPVGEWNLRTDAVYRPPFPKDHPFVLASNRHGHPSGSSQSEPQTDIDTTASQALTDEVDSSIPEPRSAISTEKVDCSPSAIPAGRNEEDESSYWYSQVEITTHLGPLRRVWMGPQCTFRTYSQLADDFTARTQSLNLKLEETSSTMCTNSFTAEIQSPLFQTLSTSEGQNLFPTLNESDWLSRYYAQIRPDVSDVSDLNDSPRSLSFCSRPSLSGLTIPESRLAGSSSSSRRYAKSASRSQFSRIVDGSSEARWRNRSGDVTTRPISIAGDATHAPIYIETGSYQDSSLGGSLSSLVGRSVDDVASCIADAMQDDDAYWNAHHSASSTVEETTAAPQTDVTQFSARTTSSGSGTHSIALAIQSALCEADFPSQETSPSSGDAKLAATLTEPMEKFTTSSPFPGTSSTTLCSTADTPIDSLGDSVRLNVESIRKEKKSKRSRRSKTKTNNSGALSSTENRGDDLDFVFDKKHHSDATSPCLSGTDSLSSSPAVSEFVCQKHKKPGQNQRGGSNLVGELVNSEVDQSDSAHVFRIKTDGLESSDQDRNTIHPDETSLTLDGSIKLSSTQTVAQDVASFDPMESQTSEEKTTPEDETTCVDTMPDEVVSSRNLAKCPESLNTAECFDE